jgi:hypothetical protein
MGCRGKKKESETRLNNGSMGWSQKRQRAKGEKGKRRSRTRSDEVKK